MTSTRKAAWITLGSAAAAKEAQNLTKDLQPALKQAGSLLGRRKGHVGFVEGENVTILYRWAEDRVDRLPEIASELARQAMVIVTTGGPPAAFAAKAAKRPLL
jgi:ABC-type uncharacterized transport system substrate-binding protein